MTTLSSTECGLPKIVVVGDVLEGPAERILRHVLRHYNLESVHITNQYDNLERADIIVALGKTAIEEVMGEKVNVTTARSGPPKCSTKYPQAKIIPTYHPAMAIRNNGVFPDIIADFGKIIAPIKDWTEPKYTTITNVELALSVIELMQQSAHVTLDIEVGVEKDRDFSHPDILLCIGMSCKSNEVWVLAEEICQNDEVMAVLGNMLEKHEGIICHNGKFDLQVLDRLNIAKSSKVYFDTMLASYALDERQGVHGLKYLSAELLGAPAYDLEIKQYVSGGQSFANIPRHLLYKYNAYDVALTHELFEHYTHRLAVEGLRELHDFLVKIANDLMLLELDGIKVNMDYLDELTDSYLEELVETEEALKQWVENPRSPKQVKEALWKLNHSVESTNEETLKNIRDKTETDTNVNRFVSLMLRHRREQKLYGTYVKGIRNRLIEDRVYPTFLLHGTVTGRLACRNPNLQNVPRESKIRKLFIPEKESVYVQADYGQAELRVVACLAQDTYLQGVFSENRDLHSEVATRFFGPTFTKDQRVRAKAVVFGLTYGREAYSLSKEFRISVAEAQRYVDTFFEAIPQVVAWRESIKERVLHKSESLETLFGRRRRFWLITHENQKDVLNEAYGFMPQSIASDLTLLSMIRIREEMPQVQIRLPVHDSILVECKPDRAEEVAFQMEAIMEDTAAKEFDTFVPFPADTEIGPSWGELV